ncbi:GTPase [Pilimelia columellifera]
MLSARHAPPDPRRPDVDALRARIDAIARFLRLSGPHLDEADLSGPRAVLERAGRRLELSRDHTVVALAGATGSGKSSLFNAVARLELSRVGVRRPTTGVAHACVWGPIDGASDLLDWIGVAPRQRFVRESPLDGDDEAALRGLVLLDLPDFDSVAPEHRVEVDRLLNLVDLVVWVVDPQKYADRTLHQAYLSQFASHRDVTVVVLNQADRLSPADTDRVVADLSGLLAANGLGDVPVLATAATDPGRLGPLRAALEGTVSARQAALLRLAADVDVSVQGLRPFVGPAVAEDAVDRASVRRLAEALAAAAGVGAVAEAAQRSYRARALAATGWPPLRWLRHFRRDPLRDLRLGGDGGRGASSLPAPQPAQHAAAALAVREIAERAAESLPTPWPAAVLAGARSRLADLPDALDQAISRTDLDLDRRPLWWRVWRAAQWFGALAVLLGVGWLIADYVVRALALPRLEAPAAGVVPLSVAVAAGGVVLGLLLAMLGRPLVRFGAARARRRALKRLQASVIEVARQQVVAPVREVLQAYAQTREALTAAERRAR